MPRVKPRDLEESKRQGLLNELWTMIALLETREEVKNFFKDLLSETEAIMLARRIAIAKLLLRGESYGDIGRQIQAGSGTIASVHRWLQGGFGGYEKGIQKLEQEIERKIKVEEIREKSNEPFTPEWMRRRYPLQYLLTNIVNDISLAPPKKLKNVKK